jgi:hypothetical protein
LNKLEGLGPHDKAEPKTVKLVKPLTKVESVPTYMHTAGPNNKIINYVQSFNQTKLSVVLQMALNRKIKTRIEDQRKLFKSYENIRKDDMKN